LIAATPIDAMQKRAKTMVLRRYLRRLAPEVNIISLPRSLYDRQVTAAIMSSDVLIGCTDNEGSRLRMNQLAVQHLLPYIDCGVGIIHESQGIDIGGQIRTVIPGGPCLECYGGINRWLAARDWETPEERALRQAHGYGLGDEQPAAALAPLNALIAAEAAACVVAIATGLRAVHPYLAYDMLTAQLIPREDVDRNPGCPTCDSGQRYGRGDALPLPGPTIHYSVGTIPQFRRTDAPIQI
jgi:molybdopterin/thiamine biosynthesis adenylyltransferase